MRKWPDPIDPDDDSDRRPIQRPDRWVGLRPVLAVAAGAATLAIFLLVAYEVAVAQIPQHRAALERLVRAQTGLDVHFNELGFRWGWYGPEAVFRRVELGEPGTSRVLLRAPELVVGFDAWRTLRSGQPETGRIWLVAPDIDFAGTDSLAAGVHRTGSAHAGSDAGFDRMRILQRWRGGRIDLDGGTLRLPDPGGSANPITLQVRRASLRRSDAEWSVYGLIFLPDRAGRMARVVLRVNGDLSRPAALSGSLRLEARRLLFPGCRDLLSRMSALAGFLPRAGSGDITADVDFAGGTVVKASGSIRALGLVFAAPSWAPAQEERGAAADSAQELKLERLKGEWRLAHLGSEWRLRIDSLEMGPKEGSASVKLDAADSGRWVRGTVEGAALKPMVAVARWLTLPLDLAGVQLTGAVREVGFDWSERRAPGDRLQLSARMEDVALEPASGDFTLRGFNIHVSGSESHLTADLRARAARLELAQSRQYPLSGIQLTSTVRIGRTPGGWLLMTDGFTLEHENARLSLSGTLRRDEAGGDPTINARGSLTGADIPLLERLLGDSTAQAFGAAASRLTAGLIRNAEFGLRGPIGELPFGGRGEGFTGSLTLQQAILSGGGLWPDAEAVDARIEWRGARIQATLSGGHAGAFQLSGARAEWDAGGRGPTRLSGRVTGRLEDALAWVGTHPQLQEFAPEVQNLAASGEASFDFNVSVPAVEAEGPPANGAAPLGAGVQARVVTTLQGARLHAVAGLPPIEAVSGSFTFDAGRLQHSVLTGTWLGGPVSLRAGEHADRGARVFAIQAQGVLSAQQLANAASAPAMVLGRTDWAGELAYVPAGKSQPSSWRMRADTNLLGVLSSLPAPFAKQPSAAMPVHFEVSGEADTAQARLSVGDGLRSVMALRKRADGRWAVSRGALRLDAVPVSMPEQPVVLVQGHVGALDLPAYLVAWQRLQWDSLPRVQVRIVAGEMLLAGQSFPDVTLRADGADGGTELQLQSSELAGEVLWPTVLAASGRTAATPVAEPAQIHLERLALAPGATPGEAVAVVAALAPVTRLSVDELLWQGRPLGRLTATLTVQHDVALSDDLRLASDTHTARGTLHCQGAMTKCSLSFLLDSSDVGATLQDFGFRPDVAAAQASLGGELQWRVGGDQPWLERLDGTVRLRLEDGATRNPRPDDPSRPFALFSVPALIHGLGAADAAGAALAQPLRELHFARLEADFQLHAGEAQTSDLHFDGDAEILMRGHTGLLARDYDQQVWILRGEDRLPEAIRRFGATPRVAAAWLSLRELFERRGEPDPSKAVLRLQGTWDDPMVVAVN